MSKFQRNLVIFLIQNLTLTSNQIKSNQIKSDQIRSDQIRSNQIKSNQIKSNQIKSNLTVILILILFQLKSNNTKRFFDAMTWIAVHIVIPIQFYSLFCAFVFFSIESKRVKLKLCVYNDALWYLFKSLRSTVPHSTGIQNAHSKQELRAITLECLKLDVLCVLNDDWQDLESLLKRNANVSSRDGLYFF